MQQQTQNKDHLYPINIEQALIGAILNTPQNIEKAALWLTSSDFSVAKHRMLFDEMFRSYQQNEQIEPITLANAVPFNELYDKPTLDLLFEYQSLAPSTANIKKYCEVIREASIARQLRDFGVELVNGINDCKLTEGLRDNFDSIESGLMKILRQRTGDESDIKLDIEQIVANLRAGKDDSVSSGFQLMDYYTRLERGNLYVIAGRPSMGKSAVAMNIAEHIAIQQKLPVIVFSLEMSSAQLMLRMLASQSMIPIKAIKDNRLNEQEEERLTKAISRLKAAFIKIDATSSMTALEIRAKARRIAGRKKLGAIVIDYLQLIPSKGDNRASELGTITASLKALAKDLRVPVIVLSQLSRAVELRPNKEPILSDLRDSGTIEQDADVVLFLYRNAYYKKTAKSSSADVIVAKNRNGSTGRFELEFNSELVKFSNRLVDQTYESELCHTVDDPYDDEPDQ